MSKYLCSLGLVTAFLLLALPEAMLYAQESASQRTPHGPVLADIRKSVIRTIGAQESTVKIPVGPESAFAINHRLKLLD